MPHLDSFQTKINFEEIFNVLSKKLEGTSNQCFKTNSGKIIKEFIKIYFIKLELNTCTFALVINILLGRNQPVVVNNEIRQITSKLLGRRV